jgi:hypothetical protein
MRGHQLKQITLTPSVQRQLESMVRSHSWKMESGQDKLLIWDSKLQKNKVKYGSIIAFWGSKPFR